MDNYVFTDFHSDIPVSFFGFALPDGSGFPFFHDANSPLGEVSLMARLLHNTIHCSPRLFRDTTRFQTVFI